MGWLYRYEAKQLQKWILASNELRSIKGASQLVLDLDQLLEDALTGLDASPEKERCWEIETNAGGGATIRFKDNDQWQAKTAVTEFAAAWPMIVDRVSPGLHVSQAFVEGFDNLAALKTQLHADGQQPSAPLPEVGPCIMRSPSTERPALAVAGIPSPKHTQAHREPQEHRFRDSAAAAHEWRDHHGNVDEPWNKLAGEFANVQKAGADLLKPMTNIDDMTSSYVAMVHIDVNDLGERLQTLTEGNRTAVVNELTKLMVDTARRSFADLVSWTDKNRLVDGKHRYPVRPVIQGGDDFSLITRGDLGIRFAENYLSILYTLSRKPRTLKILQTPVEACAGVAILHAHYPFHRGHRLAESMCRFAKDRLRHRGKGGATPSGLVFHRASDSLLEDYEEIRTREFGKRQKGTSYTRNIMLSAAPYTLKHLSDDFHDIDELTRIKEALQHSAMSAGPVRRALAEIESPQCEAILSRLGEVMLARKDGKKAWRDFSDAMKTSHRDTPGPQGEGERIRLFEPDPFLPGAANNMRTMLYDALQWKRAETESSSELKS